MQAAPAGLPCRLMAAALLALPMLAWAQAGTATLGGGTAAGPLLTREELRACLQQRDALGARRADLDRQVAELDARRQRITADDGPRADRELVERRRQLIEAFNARMQAHSQQVQAWNERQRQLAEAGQRGRDAERAQAALDQDRKQLEQQQAALEADRERLRAETEAENEALTQRSAARNQVSEAWNAESARLTEASAALKADRDRWAESCGNRRYREDDEAAIKRGS